MAGQLAADYPFFDHPGPVPMAHRGGAHYTPNLGMENSLTAFGNAVAAGYRYLETDVHASRDGVLFAFHDATLDRMTGAGGQIKSLDADVVRGARIGGREPIPYLRELFEAFPQARFNIDVKEDEAIQPLVSLIQDTGAHERVCVASFSTARLRQLRTRLGPRVATSLGSVEVAALRLCRRPSRRPAGTCAQVPHRAGPIRVVTERFILDAHGSGLPVHVWTVNDADEMRTLLNRGVDGIITDRLDVLRDVLTERGQWYDGSS